jgi:hypothetical protein
VYLSVMAPLGLLAILLWRQRHAPMQGKSKNLWWEGWRAKGSVLLVFLIALEVAAVLGAGSFMAERVAKTSQDLGSRMDHWQRGMGLLQGPVDWWLGKGLGRLPGNYAAKVPQEGFSGVVELHSGKLAGQPPNGFVSLRSAENLDDLGGSYALTQPGSAGAGADGFVCGAVRAAPVVRPRMSGHAGDGLAGENGLANDGVPVEGASIGRRHLVRATHAHV